VIDFRWFASALAALFGITPIHSLLHSPLGPISIVPQPRIVQRYPGSYLWPKSVSISAATVDERNVAEFLQAFLRERGLCARVTTDRNANIVLNSQRLPHGNEAYELRVGSDRITLSGKGPGLYYALQTLEQVTRSTARGLVSQSVAVTDSPAYRWRGMQLDVARHFFSVPVVERYIDVAAHYKLNVFQWHLTDEQGWRMPVAALPRLTAAGPAYTRSEIRDVVAYAKRRYVTIVPEIEMPSHAQAALAAYPQYGCGAGVICEDANGLRFAQTVLAEVVRDFPGRYVHVGGDEVRPPFDRAQPAFTAAVEQFVESSDRRIAGWDEILTPRLGQRAVVMAWNDLGRAAAAAKRGNDTVVTAAPLSFDAVQGDATQEPAGTHHMSTLEEVYDADVMPGGLGDARVYVLGGQANLWTERIATQSHLFYMALPRELALAEILWTPRERKSWKSFLTRLPSQLHWLRERGYAFRMPAPIINLSRARVAFTSVPGRAQSANAWTAGSTVRVTISEPAAATIRYTLDGTAPSSASAIYRSPFTIALRSNGVADLRVAAFSSDAASTVSECMIHRGTQPSRGSQTWNALVSP